MEETGQQVASAERYQRGLTLKKAGYYKSAFMQFELASSDPAYALRAFAHMGLCLRAVGRSEEAVTAFRKALALTGSSKKDTVQLLYVIGRTLESLGQVSEALEAYRWIRREDAGYRDVANRIGQLSARRPMTIDKRSLFRSPSGSDTTLKFRPTRLPSTK